MEYGKLWNAMNYETNGFFFKNSKQFKNIVELIVV